MSRLKSISTASLNDGQVSKPDPDIVLHGDPEFTTWPFIAETIQSGVWMATPGEHKVSRDGNTLEQFYILEGEIELHEQDIDVVRRYSAGDIVVIEPNFKGVWRTLSTVRKIYFTVKV
ncbi:cupin domain-containing protein [Brucella sp. 6810]|uniref:cupin domain-containing protein n=1 Tax=Brucella sp. 6810 TaxID=2769351 RepID=UPI001FFFFCE0|nr:cupin domain-containing protein [Brucella sp. 6810]